MQKTVRERARAILPERLVSTAKHVESAIRRSTWFFRPLPNAIIIGAMRSGTTSLHRWLTMQPEIRGGANKEVHYFDVNWHRGTAWYRSKFSMRKHAVQLEATPYYIFHPEIPRRLAATIPHCKLIVLLRNPVDRAYSHYRHSVRNGHEQLGFRDAIRAEEERLRDLDLGNLEHVRRHMRFSYLARGRYAEQLERWFAVFPRAQILILQSERLFTASEEQLKRVLDFLGVPSCSSLGLRNVNPTAASSLDPALRKALDGYFAPYNEKLRVLLGREFGWCESATGTDGSLFCS